MDKKYWKIGIRLGALIIAAAFLWQLVSVVRTPNAKNSPAYFTLVYIWLPLYIALTLNLLRTKVWSLYVFLIVGLVPLSGIMQHGWKEMNPVSAFGFAYYAFLWASVWFKGSAWDNGV